jgi:phage tail sheath gpL-like
MAESSNAFPADRVASGVAIETIFKNLREGRIRNLPQRIAVIAQGSTALNASYSTDKKQVTRAGNVGAEFGYGCPLHHIARQLLPVNGDGVGSIPVTLYPLKDDVSGVAAAGDLTPAGSPTKEASYIIRVNNIDSKQFVISDGDSVADIVTAMAEAVNAVLDMPIIAVDATPGTSTTLDVTAKWEGLTGNDIYIEVVGDTTAGNTFAITQPVGGLVNPAIDIALNQFAADHETLVINAMNIDDETTLDALQTFGEGRWDAEVRRPFVALTGNTESDLVLATSVSDSRPTDRINGQSVLPGSNELPFVVTARTVSRIAVLANDDPANDYVLLPLTGLVAGSDAEQWSSDERDIAVKAGSSTIEITDNVPTIGDTVTFYNVEQDVEKAYRFVVDIMKIMTINYNLDLIFNSPRWRGKPLIPDHQYNTNKNAKKPKNAVTDIRVLIDSLGANAIISDTAFAKANTFAQISESNSKRLNVSSTMKISGNANVISIDFNWGFYYGTSAEVTG